ncbi:alkaline phosphatase family protein [Rhodanobacter glycinis]|uniref:Alkaline phosphatase family protein n=1 Tax=Rhodanobacter glycinis TaxID=582702 RepID=A0A502C871_9GAMM|nr:alkaline phosphatase family protein [Rhodanobacter glycinis]TPG09785.1 alkaline phosphatase family protein [Rhodanobacter glycinis]
MKNLLAALAAVGVILWLAAPAHAAGRGPAIRHVLVISIDGLHATDLQHYLAAHQHSTLATLAADGVQYTDAHAAVPADSFPGLLGMMTGGTPAVTGVYFDVSYDRDLASSEADCKLGRQGTRVAFDEAADGRDRRTLDPARLPHRPGSCTPVYPHDYLRTNTVFNVVHDAGGHTAWIDKHPVYEILDGPDGHGIDDLYTPEIGGDYEGSTAAPHDHITGSIQRTERYDSLKADALLNQIDGWTHDHAGRAPVPTLFGMNMQAVNVAQKLAGYADARGAPTHGLTDALAHCDTLLGRMRQALQQHGLLDSTLFVVTAKHGNAPIDQRLLRHVEKKALAQTVVAAAPHGLAQLTADQGALVWLHDRAEAARVAAALRAAPASLGIRKVIAGADVARYFGAGGNDPRTPDLVVMPQPGVIYGKPDDRKLAEHGGFDDDDTHVALLLSNPQLPRRGQSLTMPVSTTQLAPTMLAALGLSAQRLQSVRTLHTPTLPELVWDRP